MKAFLAESNLTLGKNGGTPYVRWDVSAAIILLLSYLFPQELNIFVLYNNI